MIPSYSMIPSYLMIPRYLMIPSYSMIPAIRWSQLFDDPQVLDDPQLSDDPQLFDDQIEVWTLINQKSTVIPPSLMVLFQLNQKFNNLKGISKSERQRRKESNSISTVINFAAWLVEVKNGQICCPQGRGTVMVVRVDRVVRVALIGWHGSP